MIRRLVAPLLGVILLMVQATAGAIVIQGLYEGKVPVTSQDAQQRDVAVQQALTQVLIKVTGNADVGSTPALKDVINNAGRYLQQYRYETAANGEELVASFDGRGLRKTLANLQIPVWEADRPRVLAWVAIEDGGQRSLIGSGDEPDVQKAMQTAAAARAVPLLFPLLDVQDLSQVKVADVWGGFRSPVLAASKRYGTATVLAGQIYQGDGGQWSGHWQLYQNDGSEVDWASTGSSATAAASAGIGTLADRLAKHYARVPTPGSNEVIGLRIAGVQDAQGFARVDDYLRKLSGVQDVQADRVKGDAVHFRLSVQGDVQRVIRALDTGGVLGPDKAPPPSVAEAADSGGASSTSGAGAQAAPQDNAVVVQPLSSAAAVSTATQANGTSSSGDETESGDEYRFRLLQ